jgi:D-amino-acid dehydrogenase
MKIAVLGSGIIGISTAWWLTQSGHEVVVIDRCSGPERETSLSSRTPNHGLTRKRH